MHLPWIRRVILRSQSKTVKKQEHFLDGDNVFYCSNHNTEQGRIRSMLSNKSLAHALHLLINCRRRNVV